MRTPPPPDADAIRFSWTGLLVAPALAPLLLAAALAAAEGGNGSLVLVALVLPAGCIVSYGVTLVLFLPLLHLMASRRRATAARVVVLGLALGMATILPLTWMAWASGGPNSGPPDESFAVFLARWAADPLLLACPAAGALTAAAYWALGTRRCRQPARRGP
jgi:hypothetical protein